MDKKLIKEIEFDIGLRPNKNSKFTAMSGYNILRMACYPLVFGDVANDKILQLHVSYEDELYDVVEQRQGNVVSLDAIDLDLVKYYCYLENIDPDDIEEMEKDDWKVVKMKIEAYEVFK